MLINKTHVIHTFLRHRFDYIVQIVNVFITIKRLSHINVLILRYAKMQVKNEIIVIAYIT